MAFQSRKAHLAAIEAQRESSVVLYATSDRQNMASQISNDIFDFLVHHLDDDLEKTWKSNNTHLAHRWWRYGCCLAHHKLAADVL